jgi:hypothetical protein
LYCRGRLSLDRTDFIVRFFEKAPEELRVYALSYTGQVIYSEPNVAPEVLERLKTLWMWRAKADASLPELETFGWWFASKKFDDNWSIDQLKSVLSVTNEIEVSGLAIEHLAALVEEMPMEVLECLKLLVGTKEEWKISTWEKNTRPILSATIQSEDREIRSMAETLVNLLGARGYWQFRDLLPRVK